MDNGYIYRYGNNCSNCNLNWKNPRWISCNKGRNLASLFIDLSSKLNFDFAQVKGCSAFSTTWKETFFASEDTLTSTFFLNCLCSFAITTKSNGGLGLALPPPCKVVLRGREHP